MRGKFTIPSFVGFYDGEKYFDWEMAIEQEFNSHLVREINRVKHTTSEFKYFAQFWWRELGNLHQQPQSGIDLKKQCVIVLFLLLINVNGVRNCST